MLGRAETHSGTKQTHGTIHERKGQNRHGEGREVYSHIRKPTKGKMNFIVFGLENWKG